MSQACSGSLPPAPPSPYVCMRAQGYSDMTVSDYTKLKREIGRGTPIPDSLIMRGFAVEIMKPPTTLKFIHDYKGKVVIDCIISLGGDASRNIMYDLLIYLKQKTDQYLRFKTVAQESGRGELVLACNSIGTLPQLPRCLVELVPCMMVGERWRVTISR